MKNDICTPEKVYQTISNAKISYGIFHKCLFHLHTPASHDYKYFDYKEKITESTMAKKCVEKGLFPADRKGLFLQKYYDAGTFKNECEFFAFILIAETLFQNEVELVLVTDHHTIAGYDKLLKAIDVLYEQDYLGNRKKKIYPMPILGIELSCADKNHVVGIFDNQSKNGKLEENKKTLQIS